MKRLLLGLFLAASTYGQATVGGAAKQGGVATISVLPSGGGGGTALAIPCPNPWQDGTCTNTSQVADWGNQGTSTASFTLTQTITNAGGSGNLTLGSPFFTLSGTNAADWANAGTGSCTNGQVLGQGGFCTIDLVFTPSGSGARTATLTWNDNGTTTTQAVSLTGSGVAVTTLATSSCPSALSASTNYQVTANISCANGAVWTGSGSGIDINLNGFTVTYGTASQATQVDVFQSTGGTTVLSLHNGILAHGAGTNTFKSTGSPNAPGSSIVGRSGSNGWSSGSKFFNLDTTLDIQFANVIDYVNGGNLTVHDNRFTINTVGTCNAVACRDGLESAVVVQDGASGASSGGTKYYNNVQLGGPQGSMKADAPGAEIAFNDLNTGNVTGENTQDFAVFCWGSTCNVHDNHIETPSTASSAGRGIQISDAESHSTTNKNVHNNTIRVFAASNNSEYGGCALGGTYGIQFDDNPTGTNTAQNNNVTAVATACGAAGLRTTDVRTTSALSTNNVYSAIRTAGATTCTTGTWTEAKPGCAYAMSISIPTGFKSVSDSFQGDSGVIFVGADGGTGVIIQSPTLLKGTTFPSASFATFVTQNGPPSPTVVHVIDATFGAGTSKTDTSIFAQGANQGTTSIYIDWTQTVNVTKNSGPIVVGATVTFTDTLTNTYQCTTDGTGSCSVAITDTRNHNDSSANQHESRNPYGLGVVFAGCTTNTQSGLSITATASRNVVLAGC